MVRKAFRLRENNVAAPFNARCCCMGIKIANDLQEAAEEHTPSLARGPSVGFIFSRSR